MVWVYVLCVALAVGVVAWQWGRTTAPRDPHALRALLGQEPSLTGQEREHVAALEDALVEAGWVHTRHVDDAEHYDEAGRYLWWGC